MAITPVSRARGHQHPNPKCFAARQDPFPAAICHCGCREKFTYVVAPAVTTMSLRVCRR